MDEREKLLKTVKDILVGPNPLPGYTQDNGEEILFFDSPLKTYVTGILFPVSKISNGLQEDDAEDAVLPDFEDNDSDIKEILVGENQELSKLSDLQKKEKYIAEPAIDEETSKINNFHQSAMSITVALPVCAKSITIAVSAGSYSEELRYAPQEKKNDDGSVSIVMSDKPRRCYLRHSHNVHTFVQSDKFPTNTTRKMVYDLIDAEGNILEGLKIHITFRLKDDERTIFTITLLNELRGNAGLPAVSSCWFQVGFNVKCEQGFYALPDNFWAGSSDYDYKLNALLYRNVKTYGIGHGCAATWDEGRDTPRVITASVLPEYEVKPIKAGASKASLSMETYYKDREKTLQDLTLLCEEYADWIIAENDKISKIEEKYREIAVRQIEECKKCLSRIVKGVELLKTDEVVFRAFQLANKAMFMQQLHYRLPLTKYKRYDSAALELELEHEIIMPKLDNQETWPDKKFVFGKWRPFQIAFLLLNLVSMNDKESTDRSYVDLIWFPTGGGKTEAYLGLTAFTIFLRRLKNKNDCGTTVIMRYTLRLLTAQQYERASSLICAMEKLREENERELGPHRITIGLWVGESLTDNSTAEVIKRINDIRKGVKNRNVSIMLKCPWCGASMETFKNGSCNETPGYFLSGNKLSFKCGNKKCDFSKLKNPLPLHLFDDDIYKNPPTLLFGTVDKFAMLPYRPEAKSLFGGDEERTPPELIIQDELHLITGPLGSAVGLYETLISELCSNNGHKPKIVASTATISHAKRQCNALYGCGEQNVFQFPVQGTSYDDCFFAKEDKASVGRKYVGLYGNAASSSATASIFTFAAFLYAAKDMPVEEEKDRDGYWTNLCYFGSMRELGQAATWYIADIKERLEVIYRNRLKVMSDGRRYIYESGLAELTSRMSNDEIPKILKRLETSYGEQNKYPLDMCLATNMVSVGVDVPRLGLMTVTGQPKSMSEYIQATSRVGRAAAPGLVFVIYNTSKPRDKSHYEKFQSQHSKLYFSVEPTSVTPFSRPLRERALHSIFVALHRFYTARANRNNARIFPDDEEYRRIVDIIVKRADLIDPEETEDVKNQLKEKWDEWKSWTPAKYSSFKIEDEAPLMYPAGTKAPDCWKGKGWATPTSMRNVDQECGLDCGKRLYLNEDDDI